MEAVVAAEEQETAIEKIPGFQVCYDLGGVVEVATSYFQYREEIPTRKVYGKKNVEKRNPVHTFELEARFDTLANLSDKLVLAAPAGFDDADVEAA